MIIRLYKNEVTYVHTCQKFIPVTHSISKRIEDAEFVYYIEGDEVFILKDRYRGFGGTFQSKEDFPELFL